MLFCFCGWYGYLALSFFVFSSSFGLYSIVFPFDMLWVLQFVSSICPFFSMKLLLIKKREKEEESMAGLWEFAGYGWEFFRG